MENKNRKKRNSKGSARSSLPKLPKSSGPSPPSKINYDSIDTRNLPAGETLNAAIISSNVCRICSTYYDNGPNLVPVFTRCKLTERPLASIVNEYMPNFVMPEDGMPRVMCIPCATKVQEWRAARSKSIDALKFLGTHLDRRRARSGLPPNNARPDPTIQVVDLTESTDDEDVVIVELPPRVLPMPSTTG